MNLYDLGFYSGDETLLDNLLEDYLQASYLSIATPQIDLNTAIEISLLLERHNTASELLSRYGESRISPFLRFRILQTVPDESAYKVLASCFDDNRSVSTALDILRNGSSDQIYVYELGGLGDLIEGFMTIRMMLEREYKNGRVTYITTGKMARFLNQSLATPQISAVSSQTFINHGKITIHALHLIALARSGHGVLPHYSTKLVNHKLQSRIGNYSPSKELQGLVNCRDYVLLNLRSLAKLRPETSRKSYFLRSIDISACLDIINSYLGAGRTVIDITDYPKGWGLRERMASCRNYHNINCMELEFVDYAFLARNSSVTVTIDSMLTHLAAALGLSHILVLPKGHDQRWIQNLGKNETMYARTCCVYKQSSLHQWRSLVPYVAK